MKRKKNDDITRFIVENSLLDRAVLIGEKNFLNNIYILIIQYPNHQFKRQGNQGTRRGGGGRRNLGTKGNRGEERTGGQGDKGVGGQGNRVTSFNMSHIM